MILFEKLNKKREEDLMVEFFQNFSLFQWLLIIAGSVILFPVVKEMFAESSEEKPTVLKESKKLTMDTDLTNLVRHWELLSQACADAQLTEAVQKLEEVFPLLMKTHKTEPEEVQHEEPTV